MHAVAGSPWRALRELSGRAEPAAAVRDRLSLLGVVRRLPDDVRAVRRAPLRLRRHAHRLPAERVRLARRHRAGRLVGPVVRGSASRRTLIVGLLFAAVGWGGSAMTHSLPVFIAMLVPGALGIGLCNPSLVVARQRRRRAQHEQGRVQGAAGALESLGPHDRPRVGQRRAAVVRRGRGVRIRRARAARRRRASPFDTSHPCAAATA